MPDYSVRLDDSDMVTFRSRRTVPSLEKPREHSLPVRVGMLDLETYGLARQIAPAWDVYYLEREWREWITEAPRDPDAAFLGFCKKWIARRSSGDRLTY